MGQCMSVCNKSEQKVSEYDQEISQSHTADQHTHREEEPRNIYSNWT